MKNLSHKSSLRFFTILANSKVEEAQLIIDRPFLNKCLFKAPSFPRVSLDERPHCEVCQGCLTIPPISIHQQPSTIFFFSYSAHLRISFYLYISPLLSLLSHIPCQWMTKWGNPIIRRRGTAYATELLTQGRDHSR